MSGFTPTDFSTSVESEAPMKNIVTMRPLRAKPEIALPTSGTPLSKYVLTTTATIKQRINLKTKPLAE